MKRIAGSAPAGGETGGGGRTPGPGERVPGRVLHLVTDALLLRWRGFVPNYQAMPMLDGALAGLSLLHDEPNFRHSLPTRVVEYMARGVPVVTTPLPAAAELARGHKCGFVVPFGNPRAAAVLPGPGTVYLYYFHLTPWTVPAHHSWVAGGTAYSGAVQYEHAAPSRVVRPIAILIDGYERVLYLYGSLFGLILLTGLGGVLGDPDQRRPLRLTRLAGARRQAGQVG